MKRLEQRNFVSPLRHRFLHRGKQLSAHLRRRNVGVGAANSLTRFHAIFVAKQTWSYCNINKICSECVIWSECCAYYHSVAFNCFRTRLTIQTKPRQYILFLAIVLRSCIFMLEKTGLHEPFMPQLVGRHRVAWQCTAKLSVRLDEWHLDLGLDPCRSLLLPNIDADCRTNWTSPNSTDTIVATNWPGYLVSPMCLHDRFSHRDTARATLYRPTNG